ncbi:MarR family transcriptional regulator [Longimycelium tulufanense]|uniref:MarR family transcriptional regulator n=1 Tax=Longimycelium tulufanense TaxID=907463 RepID=A0A8J3CHU9_9PSEU|nr:MarR family transcriptional regulator [Longimycelium tulufanense]GGM71639.1 MarR family transcriptional regulator [Longimycelium tulufanense]
MTGAESGHGAEDLALDRQLCFALYAASRAVTTLYRPVLDALGLTYPQYLVLLVLWEHDDRTVGELGKALHLDSGTLSPLLKRLEAAGLVWRRRGVDDERSVRVGLTGIGRALRDRVTEMPSRIACATGMDPDEVAGLRTALTRLADRVNRTRLEPGVILQQRGEPT